MLRLKHDLDSPAIHGRVATRPLLLRLAPARAEAGVERPRSPALKRRAIENLAYRSNYLVDDHKRRAIEPAKESRIRWKILPGQ